jgi:hypothetical protein
LRAALASREILHRRILERCSDPVSIERRRRVVAGSWPGRELAS